MSFQAYLDNIEAKTGKTPADFRALAAKRGLLEPGTKAGEVVAWLKEDFGLGHGHAMAIVQMLKAETQPRPTADERIERHFAGGKGKWRKPYDALLGKVRRFGADTSVSATDSYISLLKGGKKFAVVATGAEHLDIGIKLRDAKPTGRFAAAGSWNGMVTHRVRVTEAEQIDGEVLRWLKRAHETA